MGEFTKVVDYLDHHSDLDDSLQPAMVEELKEGIQPLEDYQATTVEDFRSRKAALNNPAMYLTGKGAVEREPIVN